MKERIRALAQGHTGGDERSLRLPVVIYNEIGQIT